MVAVFTSVTKNWQTLLEFARTLPLDRGATTATIATPPPQRLHQHHTRLTRAQKDEVITLYQQGVPIREICQRYGISKQQVSDLRNACGIPRRPRGLNDVSRNVRPSGVTLPTSPAPLSAATSACMPRPSAAISAPPASPCVPDPAGHEQGATASAPGRRLLTEGIPIASGKTEPAPSPHPSSATVMHCSNTFASRRALSRVMSRPWEREPSPM